MSIWLLAFASAPAHALGGTFAGPALVDLPSSTATQVAIAARDDTATITVTAQAGEDTEQVAYLWPAPGFVQGTQALVEVEGLAGIEAFTRPRVERLECDELIDTLRYRTPPGCASYEVPLVDPPTQQEQAVEAVALEVSYSDAEIDVDIIDASDVDDWLDDRGLWLPQTVGDRLDPLLIPGTPVVAVYHEDFLARGDWLPPVRFTVDRSDSITLPIGAYAAEATALHDVYVYTLHDDVGVDARVSNLNREEVFTDCQIPEAVDASTWFESEVDRFADLPTATWVHAWSGPAGQCVACSSDIPNSPQTADLGIPGADMGDYRAGRLFMRLAPAQLQMNPTILFDRPALDEGLRWFEPQSGIGFVFPPCGENPDPLDVCPTVQTEATRGCDTSMAPWGLSAWLLLVALVARRRSVAAFVAGAALLVAPPAEAGGDDGWKENRPVWEIQLSTGLVGTPRVRLQRSVAAAPGLSAPMLGLQGRRVIRHLNDGLNLGLTAGIRGFSGDLQIQDGAPIGFTFVEPSLGVDMRHGQVRPSGVGPFLRYGARLALPLLDPNTSSPQVAFTGLLHVGGGIYIGNDDRERRWWPSVELRGSVVPRSDGFVTQYHPAMGLPWFTFYPGAATIELMVGIGFQ